jgi:hypothetical protein
MRALCGVGTRLIFVAMIGYHAWTSQGVKKVRGEER